MGSFDQAYSHVNVKYHQNIPNFMNVIVIFGNFQYFDDI